jgi:hypothetical protein
LFINFGETIEKNKFIQAYKTIPYGYRNNKIQRDIFILEKL